MDSTPLLQAVNGLPGPNNMQDHPAFLRASHSPWRYIPQNVLVILRGFSLSYLIAAGIMATIYKLKEESDYTNWRHVFDFSVISGVLVLLYQLITFSWTFTHLYYPRLDETEGSVEYWIVWAMSLPSNMGSLRKQFYFTMFYTTTVVFSFMNTTIYWFVTRQHENGDLVVPAPPRVSGLPGIHDLPGEEGVVWGWGADTTQIYNIPDAPFSDLFGEDWFKTFNILNLNGIFSIIMVIEILVFNSIRRPFAVGSHLLGIKFFSGLYLGWAAIGKLLTHWPAFYWLDVDEVGSEEAVAAYCIGFVALAPTMYILMQGFVATREATIRSIKKKRANNLERAAQEELADEEDDGDSEAQRVLEGGLSAAKKIFGGHGRK